MATKDLNKITVEVKINGKPCNFSNFELRQSLAGHSTFVIALNYKATKQDLWQVSPEHVVDQLGQPVTIHIDDSEGATIDFEGVITKIDLGGKSGNQGEAVLYGGSPTLLMTDDYSMGSFVDTDLASIVQETLTNIRYKTEYKINPLNNCELPYVCRYKESSYDFLNRLLASCGEWFFYDGKKIIVGFPAAPNDQEPVSLSFKYDLENVRLSSSLGNYDVEQYDYDPARDRIAQWPSPPDSKDPDKFTEKPLTVSKTIYGDYTVLPSTIPVSVKTFNMMENSVNATHFGKLSTGARLEATTRTCKTTLGSIITLDIDPEMPKYSKELGNFRIIETVHRYDFNKEAYQNEMVGINAAVEYIPAQGVVHPVAFPEVAVVTDNNDPDTLGRVKVQFIWQQLEDHPQDKTSGWMRVQHPDAGSSEAVAQNRGFFFVPEIGDQVMVAYEYGDPNRPFVTGSLYHKKNTGGIAENNKLKTITTRSGSTLTFDDDAHTILLCTTQANQIFIDEQGGSISITSAEEVNITTKNVNIDASENMTVNVGKDFTMIVDGNSSVSIKGESDVSIEKDSSLNVTGNAAQNIENEYSLDVAKKIDIHAGADMNIEADGQMIVASQKKLSIKSMDKVDIAKG